MRLGWLARTLLTFAVVAIIGAAAFAVFAWRPAIAPESVAGNRFDPVAVKRGAELASIGDCSTCHTKQGGAPFAGGRAVDTPFGSIYSTNITPEPETGIGRWSQEAFIRAM